MTIKEALIFIGNMDVFSILKIIGCYMAGSAVIGIIFLFFVTRSVK